MPPPPPPPPFKKKPAAPQPPMPAQEDSDPYRLKDEPPPRPRQAGVPAAGRQPQPAYEPVQDEYDLAPQTPPQRQYQPQRQSPPQPQYQPQQYPQQPQQSQGFRPAAQADGNESGKPGMKQYLAPTLTIGGSLLGVGLIFLLLYIFLAGGFDKKRLIAAMADGEEDGGVLYINAQRAMNSPMKQAMQNDSPIVGAKAIRNEDVAETLIYFGNSGHQMYLVGAVRFVRDMEPPGSREGAAEIIEGYACEQYVDKSASLFGKMIWAKIDNRLYIISNVKEKLGPVLKRYREKSGAIPSKMRESYSELGSSDMFFLANAKPSTPASNPAEIGAVFNRSSMDMTMRFTCASAAEAQEKVKSIEKDAGKIDKMPVLGKQGSIIGTPTVKADGAIVTVRAEFKYPDPSTASTKPGAR